ncbi:hypothetical protein [Ruegeria sp.]|uniref:hypothetical protein n=1 Tax=Ruegeria sp. TaxID=1879320 RepID=UPI003B5D04B1
MAYLIAVILIGGGAGHLLQPDFFIGFVPSWLPGPQVVFLTGLMQIALGVITLLPKARPFGGLLFALLCLGYMPLHVWDLFRDDPVIAPLWVAAVRILFQIGFIWAGYRVWSGYKASSAR